MPVMPPNGPAEALARSLLFHMRLHKVRCGANGFGFSAEALDPVDIRLAPEPRDLPFGIVAMALLSGGDCGLLAHFPCQHCQRLAISQRVERLDRPVAREQAARLFDQPGGEHCGAAPVEVRVKRCSWR